GTIGRASRRWAVTRIRAAGRRCRGRTPGLSGNRMPSLLARVASTVSARLGRGSLLVRTLRPAYEWLLDAATLGHGTEWSVNGEVFLVDPRMRRFLPPRTEPEVWELLRGAVG